jgi:hypothetical protein
MERGGDHKKVHDTREKIRAAYADGVLGQIAGALKGDECPQEQTAMPGDDVVRVLRVLEYVGPRERVEEMLRNSVHGSRRLSGGVVIRAGTVRDLHPGVVPVAAMPKELHGPYPWEPDEPASVAGTDDVMEVAVEALMKIAEHDPNSASMIARAALERIRGMGQGVVGNTGPAAKETT